LSGLVLKERGESPLLEGGNEIICLFTGYNGLPDVLDVSCFRLEVLPFLPHGLLRRPEILTWAPENKIDCRNTSGLCI
jgi:hypothetical protein